MGNGAHTKTVCLINPKKKKKVTVPLVLPTLVEARARSHRVYNRPTAPHSCSARVIFRVDY